MTKYPTIRDIPPPLQRSLHLELGHDFDRMGIGIMFEKVYYPHEEMPPTCLLSLHLGPFYLLIVYD